MSGFLYFIPNRETLHGKEIADVGLSHVLGSAYDAVSVTNGPNGAHGVVVAARGSVPSIGYYPGGQTFEQVPGRAWWLGTINGHEPTPDDLKREKILAPSVEMQLASGTAWKIPQAQAFGKPESEGSPIPYMPMLPQSCALDENGRWRQDKIIPRYEPLWQLCRDWTDVRAGLATEQQLARFDFSGQADSAVQVLAVNYRISAPEAVRLGLLTIELCREVLDTFTGINSYFAIRDERLAQAATQAEAA